MRLGSFHHRPNNLLAPLAGVPLASLGVADVCLSRSSVSPLEILGVLRSACSVAPPRIFGTTVTVMARPPPPPDPPDPSAPSSSVNHHLLLLTTKPLAMTRPSSAVKLLHCRDLKPCLSSRNEILTAILAGQYFCSGMGFVVGSASRLRSPFPRGFAIPITCWLLRP
ncbi:unnamed protein product [Arabis nemorensis]|uniref:Uncharacterized protein n=1 Tax=Arabis nemorensis TaxID=586526 RepID=A0A565C1G6_9BRAS|nr:unnamed protein product [Arabis nemorensis]